MEPKYKGSYKGQVVQVTTRTVRTKVVWEDKETGEKRVRFIDSKTPIYYLWNGFKWILK